MCYRCKQEKCCCPEKRISVVGPKGPPGIKGKDGVQGPTGPTGPTGPSVTIPVKNTVFVMKNGNDGTGLVERFDKPFLTIGAARTALLTFYTGGTAPSATNRIRIVVYSGHYTEPVVLANFVDFDLTDIVLDQTSGAVPTITDNGVDCNSIIYGQSKISIGGTSSGTAAIFIFGAGSSIRVYADLITSTSTGAIGAINLNQGTLTVNSAVSATVASTAVNNSVGVLTINGSITSGAGGGGGACVDTAGAGTTNINGNVTSGQGCIANANGTTIIKGDILTLSAAPAIYMASGTLNHTGNSTSAGVVISYFNGPLKINDSRVHCTTINTKAIDVNADLLTLKDVVIITTGTGKSMDAAFAQTVINYGAVATVNKGSNITLAVGTAANNRFVVDAAVV